MNREPSQPPASDPTPVPDSETRSSGVIDVADPVDAAKRARAAAAAACGPDVSALTTAMAVAPGVYARNRMFAFFKDPGVRRARDRASLLRGMVRQLAGAQGAAVVVAFDRGGARCRLTYRVPAIHLERVIDLDPQEAACLAYLLGRSGASVLGCSDEQAATDRASVEAALIRLTPPT